MPDIASIPAGPAAPPAPPFGPGGPPLVAEPTAPTRDVRNGIPVDLGKLRSLNYGHRTRPVVKEGRRADGVRIKATTDELNTTVTEHAKGDRQDVHLRPEPVTGQISLKECPPWLQNLAATSART